MTQKKTKDYTITAVLFVFLLAAIPSVLPTLLKARQLPSQKKIIAANVCHVRCQAAVPVAGLPASDGAVTQCTNWAVNCASKYCAIHMP